MITVNHAGDQDTACSCPESQADDTSSPSSPSSQSCLQIPDTPDNFLPRPDADSLLLLALLLASRRWPVVDVSQVGLPRPRASDAASPGRRLPAGVPEGAGLPVPSRGVRILTRGQVRTGNTRPLPQAA